jgi:hypothetical protein
VHYAQADTVGYFEFTRTNIITLHMLNNRSVDDN